MLLTYDDMVEKFGKCFTIDTYASESSIIEVFKLDNIYKEKYENIADAKVALVEKIEKDATNKIDYLDGQKIEFKNLAFFKKMDWIIRNKKHNFDSTAELRKSIVLKEKELRLNNIHTTLINKDVSYNYLSPRIIKEGDTVYVAVTDYNVLDVGLYEGKISDVSHRLDNNDITISAHVVIMNPKNNQEESFSINIKENEIHSGWTYHNNFYDKDEAVAFYNQSLKEKVLEMESKLIRKPKI